jgi:hypothetical protein
VFHYEGNFYRARPTATGAAFTAQINFLKTFDVEPGLHVFTFYTYIYCPKADCDTDDSISMKIKESDADDFVEVFRNGTKYGRVRDLEWIKDTVYYSAKTDKINVRYIPVFFIGTSNSSAFR